MTGGMGLEEPLNLVGGGKPGDLREPLEVTELVSPLAEGLEFFLLKSPMAIDTGTKWRFDWVV